jgi:hypothetical protein
LAERKMRSDLIVLRYMVQRIYERLHDPAAAGLQPSSDFAPGANNRPQRIAICRRPETLLAASLAFVGFISGIRADVSPATSRELHRMDGLIIAELADHPGILSYSSLAMRRDRWYNLVLLSDLAMKAYFRDSGTHRYAAYRLAPHYYAWIRLHSGAIAGGLNCEKMVISSTRYYTFPLPGGQPVVRELLYRQ